MFTDNKTKDLKTDSNADLIFKKGDYLHTYIVIETSGMPDGATLYLLDENLNQLYSPYDVNGNQIKSPCFIISGETDALQLPANYDGNEYTDFEEGTYNWKLRYNEGGVTFTNKIIPITVEIRDFDLETNLTPEIYPNEDIQIQLKTYIDTLISLKEFDNDRLTPNASYDESTGIITYPNSDFDIYLGDYSYTINQEKNYILNFSVKNPFKINYPTTPQEYSTAYKNIYLESFQKISGSSMVSSPINFYFNDKYIQASSGMGGPSGLGFSYAGINFPPGTYNIKCTGKYTGNQLNYTVNETMIVTTNNCAITLTRDGNNIIATYMYNNETPIPNASIQMLEDGIVVDTLITDSNGQCSIEGTLISAYKAQVIDYDNSVLLSSDVIPPELLSITVEGESTTILYSAQSLLFEDDTYNATINWGDDTETVMSQNAKNISHTYNDGLNTHIISFSKRVKYIHLAFVNCPELVNVNIPLGVTLSTPFKNCSNLRTCNVYAKTKNEIVSLYTVHNSLPNNVVFIIPQGTIDIYISRGFSSNRLTERSW